MAISINWQTKVITVPKADTQLVTSSPVEIRDLDLDWFRLQLKDLEDSEAGMPHLDTHRHNTTVTVGGVTLARVIEIINGYTVTFEDGTYAVNLVGANSNIGDVLNFNQVQVRSSNSAGLTFSEEINNQSFEGGSVYVSQVDGTAGTQFPQGSTTRPVNTFSDALAVAASRNLNKYEINGTFSLSGSEDLTRASISGLSAVSTSLSLNGPTTTDASFHHLSLDSSQMNGRIFADYCEIFSLTDFEGQLYQCGLQDSIVLKAGTTEVTTLNDCSARRPNTPITLDLNGPAADINIRRFAGGLEIKNLTTAQSVTAGFVAGKLVIHSSCTAGTIVVRGMVEVTDNSAGTTVVTTGVIKPAPLATDVADTVWDTSVPATPTSGTFGEKLKAMMSVTDWLGLRD